MTSIALWEPAPGQRGQRIATRIQQLQTSFQPDAPTSAPETLEEELFDSRARSARWVSLLSMHLTKDWRDSILSQFERLLSFDDWDDDSNLLDEASTRTFLRFVIFGNVKKLPMLGISNRRRLTSSWHWTSERRVHMEFGPADHCRIVFSYLGEFALVRQAMDGNVGDAVAILVGHNFNFEGEAL